MVESLQDLPQRALAFRDIPAHLKEHVGFIRYGEHNNIYCIDCKTYYCQHVHLFRNVYFSAYEEGIMKSPYAGIYYHHDCSICQGKIPVFISITQLNDLIAVVKAEREWQKYDDDFDLDPEYEREYDARKERRKSYHAVQKAFKKLRRTPGK